MRIRNETQARVPVPQDNKFRGAPGISLGYLKSAAQAECYRVFDKMVERASREMNEGYGPSDLTRIRAIR
jgi:hypothetical protein